jgi:hypothetical protein
MRSAFPNCRARPIRNRTLCTALQTFCILGEFPPSSRAGAVTPLLKGISYGRSACPGRFFASMEMKLLLCYVLSVYDIRYPAGQPKPQPSWYGWFRTADQSVKLEWRMKESPMFWQPKL